MKLTLFGATGSVGRELLDQALAAGHDVTVLVRNLTKLPADLSERVQVEQGDGLVEDDVARAIPVGTEAILFAIGVDEKNSPFDLCTDVTRHILTQMRAKNVGRLVWCGGGSNIRPEDTVTFGAKFVRWFSEVFLKHRHCDKEHQLALLDDSTDVAWIGVRPLQMKSGPCTQQYRIGYHAFSALSKITFADCAHAMLAQLEDDTWLGKVPIVQY